MARCAAGKITGDVRVSGYPKVQETFARVIGYVEQSDIHSAHVRPTPLTRRAPFPAFAPRALQVAMLCGVRPRH